MMSDDPRPTPADADHLQFDRVEAPAPQGVGEPIPATSAAPSAIAPPPGVTVCAACRAPITDAYFEANGKVVCPRCRDAVLASRARGNAAGRFGKAVIYGAGAAVAGAAVWYVVARFRGTQAALVTILMGWLVGRGVLRGSNNRGGVPYQLLAVLLTYLSVALAVVPDVIQEYRADPSIVPGPLVTVVIVLTVIVLVAPVKMSMGSVLSAIIIAIGLWQAWKVNRPRRLTFNGPYRLAGAGTPPGFYAPPPVTGGR
jgi:hypothetical protein